MRSESITMPNFVKIGRTVAEMWRFNCFSERVLTFTVHVRYMLSPVHRLSVCLSVGNACVPYL